MQIKQQLRAYVLQGLDSAVLILVKPGPVPICMERLHTLTSLPSHRIRYPQHAHFNKQRNLGSKLGRGVTANAIVLMPYNLSEQQWVMLKFDVENNVAQVFDSMKDVSLLEFRCVKCDGMRP